MTANAFRFGEQRLQRLHQLPFLGARIERVVLAVAHETSPAGTSADERRFRLERELTKSLVQHLVVKTLEQIPTKIAHGTRRTTFALPEHAHRRAAQLLVGGDRDQGGVVGRHRGNGAGARALSWRDSAERGTDQRFEFFRICVSDGHYGHEVWPVPIAPESPERRRVGLLQDFRFADRQPFGVARATEDHGKLLVTEPFASAESGPPLRQHHATLGHHLGGIEQNARGHVTEKTEALLENACAVGRHRQDVHGLVEAGERIQIGAEAHADRLEVLHDIVLREGLRAVEGHVLDEMRKATLVVVFQNGTGIHDQSQFSTLLGLCVASDVVANAVRQRADLDRRIDRQRR